MRNVLERKDIYNMFLYCSFVKKKWFICHYCNLILQMLYYFHEAILVGGGAGLTAWQTS